MKPKKPIVHYQSRHESGNIYWIVGMVRDVLRKQSRITEYNDMRDRVFSSGSYQEALSIIGEYVTLVDDNAG